MSESHGVIYKYNVGWSPGSVWVDMPKGARILSAGAQGPTPVIWALVDPKAPSASRLIELVWTGEEPSPVYQPLGKFIGTVTANSGLVFHLWDHGTDA